GPNISANCSTVNPAVNGVCGSSSGTCSVGTVSNVTTNGGTNGSSPATCSLVLHYNMNDTTGTAVSDSSVSNLNGTSTNDISLMSSSGHIGAALNFNGTNNKITNNSVSSLPTGSSPISYSFWINPGAQGIDTTRLIEYGPDSTSGGNFNVYINKDNSISTDYWGGKYRVCIPAGNITSGNWYHIVVTHDGVNQKCYLNDVLISTQANYPLNIGASNKVFAVGAFALSNGYNYKGLMDDLRVYGKVLSQSDIDSIWAGGAGTEQNCISGSSSTTWTCVGSNGGTSASCPATSTTSPVGLNVRSQLLASISDAILKLAAEIQAMLKK
ncbi:MAG: LamG domain-containing protein, partial [Candidatus Staskawiczbacteria bacterium]|nr:LamG domain-containing protein [Candidatus Staskawiczbacteria bacterium]